ncbi:MAG: hypothetical protein JWO15_1538 [Sphingomonadales bacterium]|nr:hypothetical protein [Sphingomonadales bacterium]
MATAPKLEGDILDRRFVPKTEEEATSYALELVDQHMHEENPTQIEQCMRLYAQDAIWEAPTRGVKYVGQDDIKKNYLGVFEAGEGIRFFPLERFGTPTRVIDDMWVTFRICGPGFENCPYPVGTYVKMRLVHIFHIEDGLIAKEMGYEGWSIDPRPGVDPTTY